jgi:hypothetical protein
MVRHSGLARASGKTLISDARSLMIAVLIRAAM